MYAVDSCHYQFPGGINEEGNSSLLTLSPNPATDELRIQNAELRIKNIEIYNLLGEKRLTLNPTSNGEGLRVDVSSLPAGIYFVKVRTDKTNFAGKFVKE